MANAAMLKSRAGRCGLAGLLVLCVFSTLFFCACSDRRPSETDAMHDVVFVVDVEGYDSTCSKIPMSVSGTGLNGSSVETTAYVGADGKGMQLGKGTYLAKVAASPLLASGELCAVPKPSWTFTIDSSLKEGTPYIVPASQAIAMKKLSPEKASETQIEAAYNAALESGYDRADAERIVAAVRKGRADNTAKSEGSVGGSVSQEASSDSGEGVAFWGVWGAAYKTLGEAQKDADRTQKASGLEVSVELTTDWENLNSEPWYVLTFGRAGTKAVAELNLKAAKRAGYKDVYVKYTGNYRR